MPGCGVWHLKTDVFLLPVCAKRIECRVDGGQVGVLRFDLLSLGAWADAEHENDPCLLAGFEGDLFVQRSAMVSAKLGAVAALSPARRQWGSFRFCRFRETDRERSHKLSGSTLAAK